MPDFQQMRITRIAPAQLTVPRWSIELQVTDSRTGAVLRDFLGANALVFPTILGSLTAAEQDELVAQIVTWLIRNRAGL